MYPNRGGPKPATGDFLGDLTNEITPKHGQGAYITQFFVGAPRIMPILLLLLLLSGTKKLVQ